MKKTLMQAGGVAAFLLALGAGAAVADAPAASLIARDAVQAELVRSKQDGSYASLHSEFRRPDEGVVGTKTREQVQRELQESITDSAWQARKLELYTY